MDWLNSLGSVLNQYTNHQPGQTPAGVEQDFDNISQIAPRDQISSGLSEAFRSDQTPPFPSMLGQLFGGSNGTMKASILNTLIATAGPQILSSILARHSAPVLPAQATSSGQLTADEADRIPPGAVAEIAEEAQRRDPNVVDRISDFYSEHPALVKTLGAAALGIAMSHLAKQKRGMF